MVTAATDELNPGWFGTHRSKKSTVAESCRSRMEEFGVVAVEKSNRGACRGPNTRTRWVPYLESRDEEYRVDASFADRVIQDLARLPNTPAPFSELENDLFLGKRPDARPDCQSSRSISSLQKAQSVRIMHHSRPYSSHFVSSNLQQA